jgi:hypothetical protein
MPGGALPPPSLTITSQTAPPLPKTETVPPPAAQAPEYFVREPGHWHWTGQSYVWIPGSYIERPYQSSVWVHGGWTYSNFTWTWTPGHWSRMGRPVPRPPCSAAKGIFSCRRVRRDDEAG